MSENTLGETFDIHGGGLDLIFPHHENEIAQSVCAHDGKGPADFARYWLHNGMLTVGGSKMAKSEGNFITVRQALAQAPGEVVRLALLMTHYRDPLDWTDDKLHQARATLDRWYRALKEPSDWSEKSEVPHEVHEALTDDLNTPLAIARLHELAATANRCTNLEERKQVQSALAAGGRLMGLLDITASDWLLGGETMGKSIELRIAERALARRERRFTDADRIRAELADLGIILEDRPDGTTEWRSA
jgi:cysteinyl-tRNA synthetase